MHKPYVLGYRQQRWQGCNRYAYKNETTAQVAMCFSGRTLRVGKVQLSPRFIGGYCYSIR